MVITDVGGLLRETERLFESAGVYDPEFEALELVAFSTGLSKAEIRFMPSRHIPEEIAEGHRKAATERANGRPLQYIIGQWEFYGMPFFVGEGVLIPRPETELLTELAAKTVKKGDEILDLCAGTGCIGISVAAKTGCKATEIELSEKAAYYTEKNIEQNRLSDKVSLIIGDALGEKTAEQFPSESLAAIVTNPPYLTGEEMEGLQREVRFEPETALYGGADGLDFYRKLFGLWKSKLKVGGLFAAEVGDRQSEDVCRLMENEGLSPATITDFNGIVRVVYAYKKEEKYGK